MASTDQNALLDPVAISRAEALGLQARYIVEGYMAGEHKRVGRNIQDFSPRNLKCMFAFGASYPRRKFVQAPLAQIPWNHSRKPSLPTVEEIEAELARDLKSSARKASSRGEPPACPF